MSSICPDDVLFQVILAEYYLKNQNYDKAVDLYDRALYHDEHNLGIRSTDRILHRVSCHECSQRITGTWQKCWYLECLDYDYCSRCLHEKPGIPHPCLKHHCIEVPSESCIKRLLRVGWEGLRSNSI